LSSRILIGDVRERLADLPADSVQCVVTSPPYYSLRDYNVEGQIGLEPTLAAYIATLVDVFREVRRVLRPDGTCWLNLGDSYAGSWGNYGNRPELDGSSLGQREKNTEFMDRGGYRDHRGRPATSQKQGNLKPKDLMMVPARVAIALQDDGWWLRSDIIWAKKNCMPESVTDRPTSSHEHVFLLTKQSRYYYDAEAVREETVEPFGGMDNGYAPSVKDHHTSSQSAIRLGKGRMGNNPAGRNQRNVWHLATEPFPEAHFATFPSEIPRRCIKAGTSEKGACAACGAPWARVVERTPMEIRRSEWGNGAGTRTAASGTMTKAPTSETTGWQPSCSCDAGVVPCVVLDPFLGSGTTLVVGDQWGGYGVGIELSPEYARMAEKRIMGDAPMFSRVEVVVANGSCL
jgi:DNA modification methylase